MDLDTVADELYGLGLEEFTATRTAREKQAKADGDRELATSIHQLAKPNTVGWLANQLVRRHRDELEPLLELGADLREATAALSGEQLRTLGRQQHQLIYALVQLAKSLAASAGRRVSDDTTRGLEDTLHAALADEAAARELLAGRLTDALQRSGFDADEQPVTTQPPTTKPNVKPMAKVTSLADRRAAQLKQLEADVRRAQADADDAARDDQQAQAAAESAEDQARASEARVDALRADLDAAIQAQHDADTASRAARTATERAHRVAEQAARRLADARQRRDKLT
jgi:hypothetical protein